MEKESSEIKSVANELYDLLTDEERQFVLETMKSMLKKKAIASDSPANAASSF